MARLIVRDDEVLMLCGSSTPHPGDQVLVAPRSALEPLIDRLFVPAQAVTLRPGLRLMFPPPPPSSIRIAFSGGRRSAQHRVPEFKADDEQHIARLQHHVAAGIGEGVTTALHCQHHHPMLIA